MTEDIYYY